MGSQVDLLYLRYSNSIWAWLLVDKGRTDTEAFINIFVFISIFCELAHFAGRQRDLLIIRITEF